MKKKILIIFSLIIIFVFISIFIYFNFFSVNIKNKIRNSQYEAMKEVNKTLISLYWGIGQEIYNQQQEKGWGKNIVEILSNELKKEFLDVKGFSSSNLWRMRNF